jgi:hypothetical protein
MGLKSPTYNVSRKIKPQMFVFFLHELGLSQRDVFGLETTFFHTNHFFVEIGYYKVSYDTRHNQWLMTILFVTSLPSVSHRHAITLSHKNVI